jgi:alpha-tubulin suppressor-like RCC1 family protein
VPVQVSGLISVTSLGGRGYHNLAVKSDGTVQAWGSGGNGELGDNLFADSTIPVQVLFPSTFTSTNWIYMPLVMQ